MAETTALHELTERRKLADRAAEMSLDELRVLNFIATRIEKGRKLYGRLVIADDNREWTIEKSEELADMLFYVACASLKRDLQESNCRTL